MFAYIILDKCEEVFVQFKVFLGDASERVIGIDDG